MSKHQKHIKLARPSKGHWTLNEWAILGSSCAKINDLASKILKGLSQNLNAVYIDTEHKSKEGEVKESQLESILFKENGILQFDSNFPGNPINQRILMNDVDLVLMNGNHHLANRQILIMDPIKKESLSRKLDRLNQIDLVLLPNLDSEIYDFIKDHQSDLQVLNLTDISGICRFIEQTVTTQIANIKGLILAGGQSTRMGFDKGSINYHGDDQVSRLALLMEEALIKPFLSVRERKSDISLDQIEDQFKALGPYAGILSAFMSDPNSAWLCIACDLPFVDDKAIQYLIERRNPTKLATCFIRSDAEFPDPLLSIWEPKAYQHMLMFLAQGYSCPRKVLINSNVEVIQVPDDKILMNVNRPEDLKLAQSLIEKFNSDA